MEETISLKELLSTLRKRITLIIIITLAAVIASAVISYFFITPIYQASTQLLVNQTKDEESLYTQNELQTNLQLINTYNVIMKSPAILDIVKDELNLDLSVAALNEKITVKSEGDSQVVNVTVTDPDANLAADIANKTAEVFQTQILEIMNGKKNVSILAKAEVTDNQGPVKPQPLLNIAIALVVGLMTGVGLAFLLEYLDNTIKTEQDVEKLLELPVLGVITKIDEQEEASLRADRKARGKGGEKIGA
jgi:capsular polysaccharide biosynthesis protein